MDDKMKEPLKHLHLFETFPVVMNEPDYADDVFRVSYRDIEDMSDKSGKRLAGKRVNDLLDGFQEGDVVKGTGYSDDKPHQGRIASIRKDPKGEGIAVTIEEAGKAVRLKPSSVEMVQEIGNEDGIAGTEVSVPDVKHPEFFEAISNDELMKSVWNPEGEWCNVGKKVHVAYDRENSKPATVTSRKKKKNDIWLNVKFTDGSEGEYWKEIDTDGWYEGFTSNLMRISDKPVRVAKRNYRSGPYGGYD